MIEWRFLMILRKYFYALFLLLLGVTSIYSMNNNNNTSNNSNSGISQTNNQSNQNQINPVVLALGANAIAANNQPANTPENDSLFSQFLNDRHGGRDREENTTPAPGSIHISPYNNHHWAI